MAGTIIGVFGKQRSGKTLFSYKLVKLLSGMYGIPVYTNIYSPLDDFYYINSLRDFPLDLQPKIFLLDEIYNGTDAQDYKKLKEISIFINTLGKQNCLFVYTSIEPSMVYNRVRNQTQLAVCVKSNETHIFYKLFNMQTDSACVYSVPKNEALYKNVCYDTNFIPLDFNWDMKNWNDKLKRFYLENYNIDLVDSF